nr:immunoglobulin heavy chain junction region [Mus musculus]MBK4197496.1 immunoglobulin heavy chain junction region [Mus musculus]
CARSGDYGSFDYW